MNWPAIGGITGIVGGVMGFISLLFQCQQLPEKKALLGLEVQAVQLVMRSPGQWLAAPIIAFKNEGTSKAEKIALEYQHWPLSWTGVVRFQDTFDISPGEIRMIRVGADTVGDPQGMLSSGKHLYSAVRVKWINTSTGKSACEVYYLDMRVVPGQNRFFSSNGRCPRGATVRSYSSRDRYLPSLIDDKQWLALRCSTLTISNK